jgi:hypothetical protein
VPCGVARIRACADAFAGATPPPRVANATPATVATTAAAIAKGRIQFKLISCSPLGQLSKLNTTRRDVALVSEVDIDAIDTKT